MALARWQATVVDEKGNVIKGARVEVRRETPGSPLANLYSDRNGTIPLGNPFMSDEEGFAAFHVIGGAYYIRATKGSFSREWRYEGVGTGSETDLVALLDPGLLYEYAAGTGAPPATGTIRVNHPNFSLATKLWVSRYNRGGSDLKARLLELDPGIKVTRNKVILTNPQDGPQVTWTVDSALDSGDYVALSVSNHSGETTLPVGSIGLQTEISGGNGALFRGAWSSVTAYVTSDVVQYGGSLWYAKTGSTNVTPVEGATWTLYLPGSSAADGSITDAKIANPSRTRNKFEQIWHLQDFGGGAAASAATNITALTNALAAERQIIIPHAATTYDFGNGEFVVGDGQSVIGENYTQIKTASNAMFKLRNYGEVATISDLSFDGQDQNTGVGAKCILLENYDPLYSGGGDFGAGRVIWDARLERLRFVNASRAIGDSDHEATRFALFTGTGAQVNFVVPGTWVIPSALRCQVLVNGVVKTLATDYTRVGQTITFIVPPAPGAAIVVQDPYDYRSWLTDLMIRDVNCRRSRGPALQLRRSQGSILIEDFFVDPQNPPGFVTAPDTVTWASIDLKNIVGLRMSRVDVIGQAGASGTFNSAAIGIRLVNDDFTQPGSGISTGYFYMEQCTLESNCGAGLFVDNLKFGTFIEVSFSGNMGYAWYSNKLMYSTLTSVRARGGRFVTGAATAPAFLFENSYDNTMTNLHAFSSTQHGLVLNNSSRNQISNLWSYGNVNACLAESGTSTNNTIDGLISDDNGNNLPALNVLGSRVLAGVYGGVRQPDAGSAFKAHKNAVDQTGVASATFTAVSFGTTTYNKSVGYNTATGLYAPPFGVIELRAQVTISAGIVDGADAVVQIMKNAATVLSSNFVQPGASDKATLNVEATDVKGTLGDYYWVRVYIEGAGAKTISGAIAETFFEGSTK